MTYQSRTTTKVLDAVVFPGADTWEKGTLGTDAFLAYSSAVPPVTAILTAEIDDNLAAAFIVVEGREVIADQGVDENWVQIVHMESKAIGTGVPGTDGIVDTTWTSYHKEFTAYPEMRVKIRHATEAADAVTAWITA